MCKTVKECFETLRGQKEACSNPSLYVFSFFAPSHFSLLFSVFVLDKLDEILAAAQHTITSDSQGQKGHAGKRDRSKSIVPNVSNEVRWELEGKDFSSPQLQAYWLLVPIMLANTEQSWTFLSILPVAFGYITCLSVEVTKTSNKFYL